MRTTKISRKSSSTARADYLTRTSSLRELGSFGMDDLAYIKAVTVDGQKVHAIYAADGTQLTVVAERDLAFATVLQHEMFPASVH